MRTGAALGRVALVLAILCISWNQLQPTFAQRICVDGTAPTHPDGPLPMCGQYSGRWNYTCCSTSLAASLKAQLQSYDIGNTECKAAMEQLLCSICDPYSAHLFAANKMVNGSNILRSAPYLCAAADITDDEPYCSILYRACKDVPLHPNPFITLNDFPPLSVNPSLALPLSAVYPSPGVFCMRQMAPRNAHAGDAPDFCYAGRPVKFPAKGPTNQAGAMCVERISEEQYMGLTPHPDGSKRAFFRDVGSKIWLMDLPKEGSGYGLKQPWTPFIDLSDLVEQDSHALKALAFHPYYLENGRIFVSFTCDSVKHPECAPLVCGCNDGVGCTTDGVAKANPKGQFGLKLCRNVTMVVELSAGIENVAKATSVTSGITDYIVRLGQPFNTHHSGQILFGPRSHQLFLFVGDGGASGDPFELAQNLQSYNGKALRIDVLNGFSRPSDDQIKKDGMLGVYAPSENNPYLGQSKKKGEIWASGFLNPSGCSFDAIRPTVLVCPDRGWKNWAEINLITKGSNYGWRGLEGFSPTEDLTPSLSTSPPNVTVNASTQTRPLFVYDQPWWMDDPVGGFFYRGGNDACMYGRYLFSDGKSSYAAYENPPFSGSFPDPPDKLRLICSKNSPVDCPATDAPNKQIDVGQVFSFGQANNLTLYMLTATGVYRIVNPALCNHACDQPFPPPPAPAVNVSQDPARFAGKGSVAFGTPPGIPQNSPPTRPGPPGPTGTTPTGGGSFNGGGSVTPSSTSGSPSSSTSTSSGNSTDSSDSGGGSAPVDYDAVYYVKAVFISLCMFGTLIGICCFCMVLGYREGKKKDEMFQEFQMAEMEQPLTENGEEYEDEEDEVYNDDARTYDEEGGDGYTEDGHTVDDSATEYSEHGPASVSGRSGISASTATASHPGGGLYAESELGSEYTGNTRSEYTAATPQLAQERMSDRYSEHTGDDGWTESGSYYGRR